MSYQCHEAIIVRSGTPKMITGIALKWGRHVLQCRVAVVEYFECLGNVTNGRYFESHHFQLLMYAQAVVMLALRSSLLA